MMVFIIVHKLYLGVDMATLSAKVMENFVGGLDDIPLIRVGVLYVVTSGMMFDDFLEACRY